MEKGDGARVVLRFVEKRFVEPLLLHVVYGDVDRDECDT
jgi:hypothetical protein